MLCITVNTQYGLHSPTIRRPLYWLNKLHRSVNVQKQKGVSVDKHFNRNGHAAVLTEQLRQRLSVINFNYSQRMYT